MSNAYNLFFQTEKKLLLHSCSFRHQFITASTAQLCLALLQRIRLGLQPCSALLQPVSDFGAKKKLTGTNRHVLHASVPKQCVSHCCRRQRSAIDSVYCQSRSRHSRLRLKTFNQHLQRFFNTPLRSNHPTSFASQQVVVLRPDGPFVSPLTQK